MSAACASVASPANDTLPYQPSTDFLDMVVQLDSGAITSLQLLTAVLSYYYTHEDALHLARALVQEFGSLAGVVNCSRERVCSVVDISYRAWSIMQVMRKFAAVVMKESFADKPIIGDVDDVKKYLMVTMGQDARESARVLFLDCKNRLIRDEVHSEGTRNFTAFYTRELLMRTSELRAIGIIIAHNHPTGSVLPSDADKTMTVEIKEALQLIGARLQDHLIIGRNATYSFREQGWLT